MSELFEVDFGQRCPKRYRLKTGILPWETKMVYAVKNI